MNEVEDPVAVTHGILDAVCRGELTSEEGLELSKAVVAHQKARMADMTAERVRALQAAGNTAVTPPLTGAERMLRFRKRHGSDEHEALALLAADRLGAVAIGEFIKKSVPEVRAEVAEIIARVEAGDLRYLEEVLISQVVALAAAFPRLLNYVEVATVKGMPFTRPKPELALKVHAQLRETVRLLARMARGERRQGRLFEGDTTSR